MGDFLDLVASIRQICAETEEVNKPCGLFFGRVISVSPLRITIDPREVLSRNFLIIGKLMRERVHELRIGDELILIRERGGQRYAVIDWT